MPLALLAQASGRARVGGEAFQSHAKGVPRSLKKQYQAAAVPAWQRVGPLVFAGEPGDFERRLEDSERKALDARQIVG